MSKVQDTMHRLIVDATIVTGCVCMAVGSRYLINMCKSGAAMVNNINSTVTEFRNTTMPSINEAVAEMNSLLAQINGKPVAADGALMNKINKIVDEFKLLTDKDVDPRNAGLLIQVFADVKNILEQLNGTVPVNKESIVERVNTNLDLLERLQKGGIETCNKLCAKNGVLDKAGHLLDGASVICAQLGNRTTVLSKEQLDSIAGSVSSMVTRYREQEHDVDIQGVFGYETDVNVEVGFMDTVQQILSNQDMAKTVDWHVENSVAQEINQAASQAKAYLESDPNCEHKEQFREHFKIINEKLHSLYNTAALTGKGEGTRLESLVVNLRDVLGYVPHVVAGRAFYGTRDWVVNACGSVCDLVRSCVGRG